MLLEELLTIVDRFQAFNVIGHLDILRRYNAEAAAYPQGPLKEGFMTLFRRLAAAGKGLEVKFDVRMFRPKRRLSALAESLWSTIARR